jgi:hypothetical protein
MCNCCLSLIYPIYVVPPFFFKCNCHWCINSTYFFYIPVYLYLCSLSPNWGVMYCGVINATFNNISVISWWTILLMENTGVPRENHRILRSMLNLIKFSNYCIPSSKAENRWILNCLFLFRRQGPWRSWLCGSWKYNYLRSQCSWRGQVKYIHVQHSISVFG